MAEPPERIDPRWPYCPFCGAHVIALDVEDYVKVCHDTSFHTIGSNGQMWLPAIRKFCAEYGNTKSIYQKKLCTRDR
jgi:hypothetical protein